MCHFDILSCIYCNVHMIYMYNFFVLTSINSCFIHVQQHARHLELRARDIPVATGACLFLSVCQNGSKWLINITNINLFFPGNKSSTVFVPIEARRTSARISPSETVLISGENNDCDRNTTYLPLVYYKVSLLYDLLKQVCTKCCNIFNCKVNQFQ